MQQVDVERSQEFRKCIECFLCQDVCHVVRDHEDNKQAFAGPRFLMRVAELDMHPLDTADRRPAAREEHGLGHVQHHQVLHRGLPRAHQDHRQRADPAQGACRRPSLRSRRVAGQQDPSTRRLTSGVLQRRRPRRRPGAAGGDDHPCRRDRAAHRGRGVRRRERPRVARLPRPDPAHRGDVRPGGSPLRLLHLRHALVRQRRLRPDRRRQRGPAAGGRGGGGRGASPRRGVRASAPRDWARGPARLATTLALASTRRRRCSTPVCRVAGVDLRASGAQAATGPSSGPVRASGCRGAGGDAAAYPWRFWLDGEPTVSVYRPRNPVHAGTAHRAGCARAAVAARRRRKEQPTVSNILDELQWRGLVAQTTDESALRQALADGPITAYCGFDPTAPSPALRQPRAAGRACGTSSGRGTASSAWSAARPG